LADKLDYAALATSCWNKPPSLRLTGRLSGLLHVHPLGAAAGLTAAGNPKERTVVISPLADAGHHSAGGLDWLLEMVVRRVVYGAISRFMRSLTLPEMLIVAAIVVVALLAYQRRA
jgi:hypothetical protein